MLNETVLAAMLLALAGGPPAQAKEMPQQPRAAARKAQANDPVSGSRLMTAEERNPLRQNPHAAMQQRASERRVTLPDQPGPRGEGEGKRRAGAAGKEVERAERGSGKAPGPNR